MQPFPTLKTDRLLLREITSEDQAFIFEGLSDPTVTRYYGVHFPTWEESQVQMDWFADLWKQQTGIWWAVCDKGTGTFMGAGGYNDWSQKNRKAEIGFWLLPAFWGKGFMQEAMPAICTHGVEKMNLHRIEGFVDSQNMACKKAMTKLRFTHEGTMRDCEIKDSAFISVEVYAKLATDDSPKVPPAFEHIFGSVDLSGVENYKEEIRSILSERHR